MASQTGMSERGFAYLSYERTWRRLHRVLRIPLSTKMSANRKRPTAGTNFTAAFMRFLAIRLGRFTCSLSSTSHEAVTLLFFNIHKFSARAHNIFVKNNLSFLPTTKIPRHGTVLKSAWRIPRLYRTVEVNLLWTSRRDETGCVGYRTPARERGWGSLIGRGRRMPNQQTRAYSLRYSLERITNW